MQAKGPIFIFSAILPQSAVWMSAWKEFSFVWNFAGRCTGSLWRNMAFAPLFTIGGWNVASPSSILHWDQKQGSFSACSVWHPRSKNWHAGLRAWHWHVNCKIYPCGWCCQPCVWHGSLETRPTCTCTAVGRWVTTPPWQGCYSNIFKIIICSMN